MPLSLTDHLLRGTTVFNRIQQRDDPPHIVQKRYVQNREKIPRGRIAAVYMCIEPLAYVVNAPRGELFLRSKILLF